MVVLRKRRPGASELLTNRSGHLVIVGRRKSIGRAWVPIGRACVIAVVAFGLVLGCSSPSADDDDAESLIVGVEPTVYQFDPNDSSQLAGVSTSPSDLTRGDCFNEYLYRDQADFLQQVTTLVGCRTPHDREAYHVAEYPADDTEPYPLGDELERWTQDRCLEEFEDFIGLEYVLSLLEIGTIVPTFDAWLNDGDRKVICFVYPAEGGRLRESVRNSGI